MGGDAIRIHIHVQAVLVLHLDAQPVQRVDKAVALQDGRAEVDAQVAGNRHCIGQHILQLAEVHLDRLHSFIFDSILQHGEVQLNSKDALLQVIMQDLGDTVALRLFSNGQVRSEGTDLPFGADALGNVDERGNQGVGVVKIQVLDRVEDMAFSAGGMPDLDLDAACPAFVLDPFDKLLIRAGLQIQAKVEVFKTAPQDLLALDTKVTQEFGIHIQHGVIPQAC